MSGSKYRGDQMTRRDFLAGAAVASLSVLPPRKVRAQAREAMRRVSVLLPATADNPEYEIWVGAFLQELSQFGWTIGRNLKIELHWATPQPAEIRRHAAEVAALAPEVVLAVGASTVGPLRQATRSVPIVFPLLIDPVGAGVVESLAHPGGNVTGFMNFEYSLTGKWLELLKAVAPNLTRVAVLRDLTIPSGVAEFGVIQAAAPSFRVEVFPVNVQEAVEIERAVGAFARISNGELIVTTGPYAPYHRDLIIGLAARHKLPAVYYERYFVGAGGLISYGPDIIDQFRRAAGYVDRILRGEKPADLPVQAPVKYETVLNLKTAKALGLDVPASVLVRADEVIE